jgi:diaminobutyrate-2-oxoglutarate transaminase
MMAGIEFYSPECAGLAAEGARKSGILIERCGPRDQVLKVLAPINIDCGLFEEGLRLLKSSVAAAAAPPTSRSRAA